MEIKTKKIIMGSTLSEVRKFIRSVLKEYVTNDIVYLKDYFKTPIEKKKHYLPFSYYQFFRDFLIEEDIDFEDPKDLVASNYEGEPDEEVNMFDDDLDLMYWLETNNAELFDRYVNYLYERVLSATLPIGDEEYPAWSYFSDNPEVIKNQWLVHFTRHEDDIARDGFKYGVSEMDKLGLTTYLSDFEKKYGGYNFAYTIDDMKRYARVRKGLYKYGEGAVLFRASGIRIYHETDREPQVIFYGNTARDIIPISVWQGSWSIKNKKTGETIFEREDLDEVVDWAIKNYPQYKNTI